MFIVMTKIFVQRPTRNVAFMGPEHEDCLIHARTHACTQVFWTKPVFQTSLLALKDYIAHDVN